MKARLAITTVVLFTLVMCSLPTGILAADQTKLPEIELKIAIPAAQNSEFGVLGKWIEKSFGEITGGRTKVKFFRSNSLVPLKDHYRALQAGILDFAFVNTGVTPGVFPLSELFQLPGIASVV